MGNLLRVFNANEMPWQTHPTVSTILLKAFENRASQVGYDAVLVQLRPNARIDWHVHPESTETIYIVQGQGAIYGAATEPEKISAKGSPLLVGTVVTIPIGLHHAVDNQGTEDLLIFAFHSPATV